MNRLDLAWIRQRLAAHPPEPIASEKVERRAAVAAVLRFAPDRPGCDLLFILRASHPDDPWSGHMAFPGGRTEDRDASALDTACRETREELELDLRRHGELLGQLDDIRASAGGRVLPLAISPLVFRLTEPAPLRPQPDEVEEIHWVPAAHLLDPASATTVPYVLNGLRFELPSIQVGERVIWGLTYMMLMHLFSVLDWQVGA